MKSLRIGLSHGDDERYGNYPKALRRIGERLGYDVETVWLHEADAGRLDGIVFTGGEDVDPARYGRDDARDLCDVDTGRDAFEWALRDANAHLPTLAVCRGAQLLNVYHGGTLIPHLATADDHVRRNGADSEHALVPIAGSLLEAMANGDPRTNSSHHQAVDRLAAPFRATAYAPDGTLEAYEYADRDAHPFFLATQWHPERMPERSLGDGPIAAFLTACAEGPVAL
jgi:putative glutamine amidotransferase